MTDLIKPATSSRLARPLTRREALRLAGHGIVLTGFATMGSAVLAACSPAKATPSSATVASPAAGSPSAASLSGNVSVISWEAEHAKQTFEAWQAATGVTVEVAFMADPNDPLTKLKAGGAGQIDVVVPYNGFVEIMHAAGVLQPIDTNRLTNYGQLFPSFQHPTWQQFDGQDWAVPHSWGGWPMTYNADAVAEAPTSWLDLKKPEFKGKIVMVDDAVGTLIVFGNVLGYDDPTRISAKQLEDEIAFLIDLKKTQARTVAQGSELADILARKEAWIVYGQGEEVAVNARAKGVNAKAVTPKEGSFAWVDSYSIAAEAPNMDNAYAFIDEAISADACFEIATTYGTTNKDAAARLPADTRELWPYDTLDRIAQYDAFPTDASEGFVTIDDVMKAWERFKAA